MIERNLQQEEIKQGWKDFICGRPVNGKVRTEVLASWKRCRNLGVDPLLVVPERLIDTEEIHRRMERNEEMLEVAVPAVEYLYQFLRDASLFVSISDVDGYLLNVQGDTTAIDPENEILYTCWSEQKMGNNPIGTTLYSGKPLQVSGYEHYCRFPHHFSGAGTPIHDPDGKIIGAISITHVTKNPHPHTLAMIVMTAYSIELELKERLYARKLAAVNEHLSGVLDFMSECLLVLDHTGEISMVNRAFLEQFHMKEEELIHRDIRKFLKDPEVVRQILDKKRFTDEMTGFLAPTGMASCTVTHSPVILGNEYDSILILSPMARVRKLADKIRNPQAKFTFDNIVARADASRKIFESAQKIAETDSNVLLLGESGTGKDVFAQAIHNASSRRNGPFVPINCGAIQKELIASELFGYEEGAFTGARKGGSIGKLEAANGGTIFLDEIGEMPLDLQPLLLRAIEQRMITRIGGKTFIPLNVRIIAATNRDLYQEVQEGRFRQDLYYRLDVFSLRIPPLRERSQDIPMLVKSFLRQMNEKYGKMVAGFSSGAMEFLLSYSWPGNVRELQNCVERCVALSEGRTITEELLPPNLRGDERREIVLPGGKRSAGSGKAEDYGRRESRERSEREEMDTPLSREEMEKADLLRVLRQSRWNITLASEMLGVTRATVYRRIKRYHLDRGKR
jgi:transcriptional regulator of acetoin/glycerol metabolism